MDRKSLTNYPCIDTTFTPLPPFFDLLEASAANALRSVLSPMTGRQSNNTSCSGSLKCAIPWLPLAQRRQLDIAARRRNHAGAYPLPQHRIRYADDGNLSYAGQRAQQRFHFRRADVVTAAIDDLFQPPDNDDVSLAIEYGEVPGMEPAVAPTLVAFATEIAVGAARSSPDQFTRGSPREDPAFSIDDAEFGSAARPADRAAAHRSRVIR